MPLSAPAVRYTDIEEDTFNLLHEWLSLWFNDASHAIGKTAARYFPPAALRYQQAELPQPVDGLGISVALINPGNTTRRPETIGGETQEVEQCWVRLQFYVRAAGKLPGTEKPAWHARRAASLLYAILDNTNANHPLVQKGFRRISPRAPELLVEKEFATRLVSCRVLLRYPVLSQV